MTSTMKMQQNSPTSYAWYVGSVYLFNQMIGTGLLAMPKAFVEVGWVLGLIIPCVLAFMSYCTATYVIEAHSIHNAITKYSPISRRKISNDGGAKDITVIIDDDALQNDGIAEEKESLTVEGIFNKENKEQMRIRKDSGCVSDAGSFLDYDGQDEGETNQLCDGSGLTLDGYFQDREGLDGVEMIVGEGKEKKDLFGIQAKAELGDLCKLFFNTTGQVCYYITICLYLTGAEAVYFATIGKSLTSAICCDAGRMSCFGANDTNSCNTMTSISIKTTYRITIITVSLVCLPLAFLNLSKTRYIQIMTMIYRWFAIFTMVALAIIRIVTGKGAKRPPRMASFKHIPDFSGIMLFGFLIQYSLSSVITPVRNKKRLTKSLVLVYACVLVVTSLLTMTAAYGFDESEILDLYTSNFVDPIFFKYALELYPVLALCANIPIFAITLRENLKTLFLCGQESSLVCRLDKFVLPVLALVPAVAISLYTYDVGRLVAFTGSYAGAIIEYVIPTVLVLLARTKAKKTFGVYANNQLQSPFRNKMWSVIVLTWYVVCVSTTIYKVCLNH